MDSLSKKVELQKDKVVVTETREITLPMGNRGFKAKLNRAWKHCEA